MSWGVPSKTKPSTVLISRTITVVPGSMPSRTISPALSVKYTPSSGPTAAPAPSTTLNATPDSGSFSVPSMNFLIISVVPGSLSKIKLFATPERTTMFLGVSSSTYPVGARFSDTTTVELGASPVTVTVPSVPVV